MQEVLTRGQVVERIRSAVDEAGGPIPFAEKIGKSDSYVRNVLSGRIKPTPVFCKAVGVVEVKDEWRVVG